MYVSTLYVIIYIVGEYMKKGFTLVEMLAVILILGIILLIGVPIYQGIQKSTNESIYESKIANVK